MDSETLAFSAAPRRERVEKTALREASACLCEQGNLTLSIQSLIFCLLVLFSWITATQLLVIPFDALIQRMESISAMILLEIGYYILCGAMFLVLVMPVWLGRVHLLGRMCTGGRPMMREVLYYFTSFARYRRALMLSLILAVQVILPALLCAVAFFGAFELYFQVFYFDFPYAIGVLLLLAVLLLALAFSIAVLFATGLYRLTAAIAVGNEEISVLYAFVLAVKTGKRNWLTTVRFTLRSLWHLLLSLITLGVLFVLWYAHHYIVSYLRLAMALCPKGENQQ